MKKIAVVLSGCGYLDGAEITEAVSTYISLSQHQAKWTTFALDQTAPSVNHISTENSEDRNILSEAARITRGQVQDLKLCNPEHFDGIVFPGGFGVAKNLCDWASQGAKCKVNPLVEKLIQTFFEQSKPICALCISPALIARVLKDQVTVTIGNDTATISEITKTGAQHEECKVTDFISDRESKVISSPAYMYDQATPAEVFTGVQAAIKEFILMA